MRARDIMTADVETVAPDDDVSEVLTRLARADFNGFPVVDDGTLVGIVTQGDLVSLFQPSDRTLWIPIGFPPFLESLTYAIDLSWDELDVGVDLLRNAGKPISEVMSTDVVTVGPDDDLDTVLGLLADEERDINRLPVVDREPRSVRESRGDSRSPSEARRASEDGSDSASGEQADPRADYRLVGIIARQDLLRTLRDQRAAGTET